MAYEKQNFIPKQKLKAAQLNHMEDGIANAVSVTEQTFSEEQKAQARENIGAAPNEGNYELIETITIETVGVVSRTTEPAPDRRKYNFSAMFVHVLIPAGATVPSGSFIFFDDENAPITTVDALVHRWTPQHTAEATGPSSFAGRVYRSNGIWCWYLPAEFGKNSGSTIMYESPRTDIGDFVNDKMIRKIYFTHQFPVGAVINIYGVRA